MKNIIFPIRKASALCCGFFALLVINACKENNSIKPDLVPGVDNINTFELTEVDLEPKVSLYVFDSLFTGNVSVPKGAIGHIDNDPFFGKITSSLFLQFSVPSLGVSYPESLSSVDSMALVLPYDNFVYGDSVSLVSYEVYEINDPSFKVDTANTKFYSSSNVGVLPTIAGSYEGYLSNLKNDTFVGFGNDTLTNQLRIKLNNSILDRFTTLNESNTANNEAFTNFLQGLFITPKLSGVGNRSLNYFNIFSNTNSQINSKARLEVYYTRSDSELKGVLAFPFDSKYSAFFSRLNRDYTGSPSHNYFLNPNNGVDSFLLTGGPGLHPELEINNLSSIIPNSSINLARLEMYVKVEEDIKEFKNPPIIFVSRVEDDGKVENIADYMVNPNLESTTEGMASQVELAASFVGGTPEKVVVDGQDYYRYTFNMPREIQHALFNGKDKLKLRFYSLYQYAGAFRMIANGFNNSLNTKAKFNIIYTKP